VPRGSLGYSASNSLGAAEPVDLARVEPGHRRNRHVEPPQITTCPISIFFEWAPVSRIAALANSRV
jgi:hypothetical protein